MHHLQLHHSEVDMNDIPILPNNSIHPPLSSQPSPARGLKMTDQPTPASDETEESEQYFGFEPKKTIELWTTPASDEKLLIFGWIVTVLGTPQDFDTTKYNELTDKLYELHTAAVQAESRKLLERLKQGLPMQQECDYHGGGEEGCPGCSASDEHNNTLKTVTALLDSEQQKLGGSDDISE